MWKFQDLFATQIIFKINFGHFEAPKTAFLTIWETLNFEILATIDIFNEKYEIVEPAVFDFLKSVKIDFT